jgi:hypothetical protein
VQLRAITPVFSGICFDIADSIGGINRRCKSGINRALRFLRSASSLRDAPRTLSLTNHVKYITNFSHLTKSRCSRKVMAFRASKFLHFYL